MATGDFYTATVKLWTLGGFAQFNLDYEMTEGTMNAGTLTALATVIMEEKLDLLLLALSTQVEIDEVFVRPITDTTEMPGGVATDNSIGARGGDALPNFLAAVIKQITDAPNAKHNGRIYVPGVSENDQAEGTIAGAVVTLLDAFADELLVPIVLTAPDDSHFKNGVISRWLDGVKRTPPVFFTGEVYSTDTKLRQQRRRTTERAGIANEQA